MVKTARLLGEEDLEWFEKQEEYVRKAIVSKFFNPLKCSFGGQAADAMALELGLFPEDRRQRPPRPLCTTSTPAISSWM